MMDRFVVWTEVWRPLLISRRPSNIYVLLHWPSSGSPNWGRRNIVLLNLKNPKKSLFEKVGVKSKKWEEGLRKEKELIFRAVERQTSFLGTKGGREAGSQAVPLLHLTAVQNDSWRLPRRHHGRADVAAAFQVQQHLIPPFLLSIALFFFFFFSSSRCSAYLSAHFSMCCIPLPIYLCLSLSHSRPSVSPSTVCLLTQLHTLFL